MAQDVGSIVASFVPGYGTAVAAGLGVTSAGTDLVADFMDPAVTTGEALKNLGVNAGFALLGMIPGAKMTKVAKTLVKWTPKIITAAAGLGIAMDPSTQATFKKLGDGTTSLNRQDWKNIAHVLSLVAAGTRGANRRIAKYKVQKGIVNSDELQIEGVKNKTFTKDQLAKINDKLAKIDKSDKDANKQAIKEIKRILPEVSDDEAKEMLKAPSGNFKVLGKQISSGFGKFRTKEGSAAIDK